MDSNNHNTKDNQLKDSNSEAASSAKNSENQNIGKSVIVLPKTPASQENKPRKKLLVTT